MNTYLKVGLTAVAVVAAVVIGLQVIGPPVANPPSTTPPPTRSEERTPSPTPAGQLGEWSGPVRTDLGQAVVAHTVAAEEDGSWAWADPGDAGIGWVDITRVRVMPTIHGYWHLEVLSGPPRVTYEEGLDRIVAHGLVLDTTGDGVADYVVGVDDDGPRSGGQVGDNTTSGFRAWVTNLASGVTEGRSEPPYGLPVEFSHQSGDWHGSPPTVTLFFLAGSAPADFDITTLRYYAWTSVTDGGRLVAWDYAPDAAWLGPPPAP